MNWSSARTAGILRLWPQRLGRTVPLTNRMDWTVEQVVAGYSGQHHIERVFRTGGDASQRRE